MALEGLRLVTANAIERKLAGILNEEFAAVIKCELSPYRGIMSRPWYKRIPACRLPSLSEVITVEAIERVLPGPKEPERIYDEKFHILQPPRNYYLNLEYQRHKCGLREAPISVAFVDIDDFKSFNSDFTFPRVDAEMLPRFMSALESHVFARGAAYRGVPGGEGAVLVGPALLPPGQDREGVLPAVVQRGSRPYQKHHAAQLAARSART
jgi:GGDEF domain-containing protein